MITLQLASHRSQGATNAMQMPPFYWFIHSGVILSCIKLPQNSGYQAVETADTRLENENLKPSLER